jgi:predicted phosphodiesterase
MKTERKEIRMRKGNITQSSVLIILLITGILLLVGNCIDSKNRNNYSIYQEVLLPAGNEYVDPMDPQNDDSDQILTEYDQFPDTVKTIIEQILPGGYIDKIVHWQPFGYVVYKTFAEGHSYKIFVYLCGKIYLVYYFKGKIFERPGFFFEKGSEKDIALSKVPEIVLTNVKKSSGSSDIIKTWIVESKEGLTYVVEVAGFQNLESTAFAYKPDGVLKTMSPTSRMRMGVNRLWEKDEIEDLLGKYRKKYDVDTVLKRIQAIPFNPEKGFRFVIFGDSRINKPVWETICKSINQKKSLFAIAVGDIVREGEPEQFDEYFFKTYIKYGKFPLLPVIGNHDIGYDDKATGYLASFGQNSLNYYFDYGNARFIILDNVSKIISFSDLLNKTDQWLAETPKNYYKFVFIHYPPGNIKKWSYHSLDIKNSIEFTQLMTKHEVDYVFAGHIHAYSTTNYQGVNYVITGGAGAVLHKQYGPKGTKHHYIIIDVKPDGIEQTLVQFHKEEQ